MTTSHLTRDEEAALDRVRRAATLLDEAIRVPGTDFRIGADPLLGVLPVSGDIAAGAISMYIVAEAARLGVPPEKLTRMLLNVGVDVAGGSVPVLGLAVDAFWKANRRNVTLLERHLGVEDAER